MASLYLLDTSTLVAALKGRAEIRRRLESKQLSAMRLSAIVLANWSSARKLARLAQRLPLVGVDIDTSRHYAKVHAFLETQGMPIGANDTWIAAQALAIDAILVTDDEREFSRVPGLALENWLERA